MLKKEEEEFGRYHDKKYKNITNEIEEKKKVFDNNIMNIKDKDEYYKHKEINIEYRDENGKKLKPKEMARYQALIFHGEKSSVRKREKKLLREKYQVFVQNPNTNKTISPKTVETYINTIQNHVMIDFKGLSEPVGLCERSERGACVWREHGFRGHQETLSSVLPEDQSLQYPAAGTGCEHLAGGDGSCKVEQGSGA